MIVFSDLNSWIFERKIDGKLGAFRVTREKQMAGR